MGIVVLIVNAMGIDWELTMVWKTDVKAIDGA